MKNLVSQAEIAFWDKAISLMSHENTPRVYSQTLASMTLRLQSSQKPIGNHVNSTLSKESQDQAVRLGIISATSLVLGIVIGLLNSR